MKFTVKIIFILVTKSKNKNQIQKSQTKAKIQKPKSKTNSAINTPIWQPPQLKKPKKEITKAYSATKFNNPESNPSPQIQFRH